MGIQQWNKDLQDVRRGDLRWDSPELTQMGFVVHLRPLGLDEVWVHVARTSYPHDAGMVHLERGARWAARRCGVRDAALAPVPNSFASECVGTVDGYPIHRSQHAFVVRPKERA